MVLLVADPFRPNDQIILATFNKSYLIKNELYEFDLVPAYQVRATSPPTLL